MSKKRFEISHDDGLIRLVKDNTTKNNLDIIDCCSALNDLFNKNEQLKKENKHLRCTIESNSQDDYIDFLEKQNERLKERIEELASNDKIVFMVNE